MSGRTNSPSSSPYQQLRRNRQIKVDVHRENRKEQNVEKESPKEEVHVDLSPISPSSFPSSPSFPNGKGGNVWIKPKSNAVPVPPEILKFLSDDIEKRHAGLLQAEEILWFQSPRPLRESIKKSWAFGLSLMSVLVSIFICVAIWFYVPGYLRGTALVPPIVALIVCALLIKRIRIDLAGCYALTKYRAIIIVPRRHLFLKPLIRNFDFITEKNIIMVHYLEARLQDTMLTREPVIADLVHNPRGTGTASFYPRTTYSIPFRFHNIQNSHAFETDFTEAMTTSPLPVNGGRLRIEKPDFEQQRAAARKFKIYPIIGAVYLLVIVGVISALLWGAFYTQLNSQPLNIAMVVLAWFFAVSLSTASFYPVYSIAREKREAMANARYVKYMHDQK